MTDGQEGNGVSDGSMLVRRLLLVSAVVVAVVGSILGLKVAWDVSGVPFLDQIGPLVQSEGLVLCLEEDLDVEGSSLDRVRGPRCDPATVTLQSYLDNAKKRLHFDWHRDGKLLVIQSLAASKEPANPLDAKVDACTLSGNPDEVTTQLFDLFNATDSDHKYWVVACGPHAVEHKVPCEYQYPGGSLRDLLNGYSAKSGVGWRTKVVRAIPRGAYEVPGLAETWKPLLIIELNDTVRSKER